MAASELQRTHPLTVLVGTGRALVQMVWAFVAFVFLSMGGSGWAARLGLAGLILVASLIAAGASWLNWLYFRYGVVGTDLVIESGWLVRKRRAIPIGRIQGIDIRADLVSRLLGLANVVVQTAGGGSGDAEASIGSIPLEAAEALRSSLLAERHATNAEKPAPVATIAGTPIELTDSGVMVGADPIGRMSDLRGAFGGVPAETPAPTFEYKLPLTRLLVAGATSNAVLGVLAAFGAAIAQGAPMLVSADGLSDALAGVVLTSSGLGLAALIVAGSIFAIASRDYGFVARRVADRIETEAGLFERRMTSLPVRRIQAVRVESNPLRRMLGFQSVYADTAGFGRGDDQQTAQAASPILPLSRADEVAELLHSLLPESEHFPATRPMGRRALRFYLTWPTLSATALVALTLAGATIALWPILLGSGYELAVPSAVAGVCLTVGAITAALQAAAWRAAGVGADERALCIAYGTVGRYSVRIPRSRIQSISWRQTPFQARAGLATLRVATVSGSRGTSYSVRHLDVADAIQIVEWYSPS